MDKVTTGTYKIVPSILNVALIGSATAGLASGSTSLAAFLVITQFSDQVKIRIISQLINGISSVLQKLLKYFVAKQFQHFFCIVIF